MYKSKKNYCFSKCKWLYLVSQLFSSLGQSLRNSRETILIFGEIKENAFDPVKIKFVSRFHRDHHDRIINNYSDEHHVQLIINHRKGCLRNYTISNNGFSPRIVRHRCFCFSPLLLPLPELIVIDINTIQNDD